MRYEKLSSTLFIKNRAKLIELLPPKSMVIISSNDIMPTNADGTMGVPFSDSNFNTMADIVSAVDFSADSEEAGGSEAGNWMSSELWASLNEKMLAHLQSISLRQLVSEQRAKGITVEPAPSVVKRGVFAKPKSQPLKMNVPNSVFALAASLVPTR